MSTLNDLVEMEDAEPEMIADILPADARLSFSAPITALADAFARAASVAPVPGREVIPGTEYALLEVIQATQRRAAHLRLTASDGDQTVSVVMDRVTVHMEGSALVPPHRVKDILKLAPVAFGKLEVVGSSMTIRAGRALWTVQTPPGEKMASRQDVSGIEKYPISAVELAEALSKARVAASTLNARVSLMQIQIKDGAITGCDGGRLHRATVDGLSHEINVTIPVKSVDEFIRALKGAGDDMVTIGYDEHYVVLEVGNDVIVAQRLLVDFPNVEPLILGPTFDNDVSLTVPRQELIDAVKRIRVNADPDSAAITLTVTPGKGDDLGLTWVLVISARDRAKNASKEAMLCHWTGARERSVTFNHHYLTDMLALVPEEQVTLKMGPDAKTVKNPILIEGPLFVGVIQQMALVF